ncbi:ankyrin repeat-containing domain protein, partial [Trichophaea hybrida]
DDFGKTALHHAAEKGLQSDVEEILAAVPNKGRAISAEDDAGLTPLHCAAIKGHKHVLHILLSSDGHETKDHLQKVDKCGQTLLHLACYSGQTDVALLLLE